MSTPTNPRAAAFGAIEADIADLAGAEAVLSIVAGKVLQRLDAEQIADYRIPKSVAENMRVYLLTPEEDEALHHAMLHLGDLTRQLDRNYHRLADEAAP